MSGDGVPNIWRAEHGYVQAVEDPFVAYGAPPPGAFFVGPPPPPQGVQYIPVPVPLPEMIPWMHQPVPVAGPAPGYFFPAFTEVETKKKKKDKKTKPSTKAPGVQPGFPYLYPKVPHISIHLFAKGTKANELANGDSHYRTPETQCFTVANHTTLKDLVSMLDLKEKSVVYQVHELGDGRWGKGLRIDTGDGNKGKQTLEDVGWVPDRPIWIIIEKPKKKD
ncbi:hypothetical protein NA57DRAFT_72994 [Rhizodiscina lignyota]|uniref:Uncharacterized protein n=1 Tax=Rhizodiscina lignyota TaxID=1504668 RepID=A0A9P4IHA3_9PEZI|nr:hypothetical protein NA57DRAFT_72994 [Rhizodiscina lignyota]